MSRWPLRLAVTATLLLILEHFIYTFQSFHTLTLQAVQFGELGLPLLFLAFLNGIVWTLDRPATLARFATHLANVLMLVVAGLVAWLAPVAPAYLVLVCAVALTLAALHAQFVGRGV